MSLTKERITAIKKEGSLFVANGEREDGFALDDLCELALLGLRVEEAPWTTALAPVPEPGVPDPGFSFVASDVPPEWNGRRVRLVVEDQE